MVEGRWQQRTQEPFWVLVYNLSMLMESDIG